MSNIPFNSERLNTDTHGKSMHTHIICDNVHCIYSFKMHRKSIYIIMALYSVAEVVVVI